MIRSIVVHPNRMLRKRSRELASLEGLTDLVSAGLDTMIALNVSSLAAVQLGVPLRVIFINGVGRPITLFNPRIVKSAGQVLAHETCASVPGRTIDVQRHEYVKVEHLRPHGLETFDAVDAELAVAIQHEIDHLNGVLHLDRDLRNRPAVLH